MRSSPVEVIVNSAGRKLGLLFQHNFCAEQECGIRPLLALCNIGEGLGLDRRTGIVTDDLNFNGGESWFAITRSWQKERITLPRLKDYGDMQHAHKGAAAGWSDDDVGIWLKKDASDDLRYMVKTISAALTNHEPIVVMMGGRSNPFGGGGLIIATRAMVDQDPSIDQHLREADDAANRLEAAWAPVEKELRDLLRKPVFSEVQRKYYGESKYRHVQETLEKGIHPFYMRPRSLAEAPVENSAYPFLVWLNPCDQDLYQSGWYTVEQLKFWAQGEGPVIENGRYFKNWMAVKAILAGGVAFPHDYEAICPRCGFIHHDGNAAGRQEMLNKSIAVDNHGYGRLIQCEKCGCPGKDFVFADDDPGHYRNKKKS